MIHHVLSSAWSWRLHLWSAWLAPTRLLMLISPTVLRCLFELLWHVKQRTTQNGLYMCWCAVKKLFTHTYAKQRFVIRLMPSGTPATDGLLLVSLCAPSTTIVKKKIMKQIKHSTNWNVVTWVSSTIVSVLYCTTLQRVVQTYKIIAAMLNKCLVAVLLGTVNLAFTNAFASWIICLRLNVSDL